MTPPLPVIVPRVPRLPRSLLPRPPIGPDPLRRIAVPRDLEPLVTRGEEVDPAEAGMTRDGVERIWRAALGLYRTGVHPAVALCVRRHGAVVLDRSVGHARGNAPGETGQERVLATPATPHVIFSASKAVTATVVHLLDERGLLHGDDLVCEYVPEYGTHGKHRITIDHVLSHRAGVPNLPASALDLDRVFDREFLLRTLCDARPATRPGRLLSYHAISGGFILAEVVRRVTGKEIGEVLRDEILDPLGFRWGGYGVAEADLRLVARAAPTGTPSLPPLSTILTRALGVPPDEVTRLSNDPRTLSGTIPSANVVTTANELSRFFDLLRAGGELDGTRVLGPRTVRRAVVERSYREFDLTLGAPLRHASGYMLGARAVSLFGPDTEHAFGHLGFTNVLGWADPQRELSVGLIPSGKPTLHGHLGDLWALTRRIGREAPKVRRPVLAPPR